ncbi:spore germination protein KA [Paenibacillus albidus]|uniref:Spore germination protein KA n=1 Tax=Paenibacillus albidus TaxID=2041023 RepID=A0A917FIS2_9BACL|nr:spore germination protein [Paenibacillus albidus]GGF84623.1 spore germination protein KA [Paenibacillus albidus]
MNSGSRISSNNTLNDEDSAVYLHALQEALGYSQDIIFKKLRIAGRWPATLVFIEGLVDTQLLFQSVLESLMAPAFTLPHTFENTEDIMQFLIEEVLIAGGTRISCDPEYWIHALLSGESILLLEGKEQALIIMTSGGEERALTEPTSQTVIRGPMDGFTEGIKTNLSLVRRRIKDRNLRIESFVIGEVTSTDVSILYMKTLVRQEVLEEVRSRLESIDIDGILESGYIEEYIQDTALTPFPTVFNTDRPDVVAAALLEGRVAIVVSGTPFVLLVPALFMHFFQSPEDYYNRSDISTLLRIVRLSALFISMLVPALYIALTTYHQEMLPTGMLISLAAQREGVPFPAFVEAILMEFTYEILREAGVRIPRNVGQAISIVGTLVIGQAAVEAGIISAAMVIIVSITAISSFVIPVVSMSISIRIVRFAMMILSGAFGMVGIFVGIIILLLHLTSLRSFGISYLSPFSPSPAGAWKDSILRVPWPYMNKRPFITQPGNRRRQSVKKGEGQV